MNKAFIPFGGANAFQPATIPILNVQLPITDEYKELFEPWVAKTGLDQAGVARLLIELGAVALKRIFDEEASRPTA